MRSAPGEEYCEPVVALHHRHQNRCGPDLAGLTPKMTISSRDRRNNAGLRKSTAQPGRIKRGVAQVHTVHYRWKCSRLIARAGFTTSSA